VVLSAANFAANKPTPDCIRLHLTVLLGDSVTAVESRFWQVNHDNQIMAQVYFNPSIAHRWPASAAYFEAALRRACALRVLPEIAAPGRGLQTRAASGGPWLSTRCPADRASSGASSGRRPGRLRLHRAGCLYRTHHLVKTFWGWRDQQLPDGTGNLLRYIPACIRRGPLGNGEHVIPSNPVVDVAHGHG
jgi:hypothetical protein